MSKEARLSSRAAWLFVIILFACATEADAAPYRTRFFLVSAPNAELARQVGEAAEAARRDLAIDWLGRELPDWRDVCPIHVNLARGAGGETRFEFQNGQPGKWRMIVQGTPERILDSVIPHEVLHMVFATHFGQGLPRWADEGACTTVEHISERSKQEHLLYEVLTTDRGIAFNQMFAMREYPKDMLPLYAQGYSVARFLIAVGGKRRFVEFVGEGLKTNNWTAAVQARYRFPSLGRLQANWLEWVRQGGREEYAANYFLEPLDKQPAGTLLASNAGAPTGREAAANGSNAAGELGTVNVVATPVAPRTLPPTGNMPFQILSGGGATSATSAPLVPVPQTGEPIALAQQSPSVGAGATSRNGALRENPPTSFAPAVHASTNSVAATPASVSGDSWYARQRDAYRTNPGPASERMATTTPDRAVSRPQPFEQARQIVIEQERPAGSLAGAPLPGTTLPSTTQTSANAGGAPVFPATSIAAPSYAPGSTGGRRAPTYVSGGERTIR